MPVGTISAYNLADQGVNVDKAQVHKEDGELTKAQNATTDPTGVGGGVRKRPGLIEFNGSAGAGSFLGGVGVPIALLTDSINGTALAGVTRTIYWGRATTGANLGATQGWWKSTDKFATTAGTVAASAAAGLPSSPRSSNISEFGTAGVSYHNGAPGSSVTYANRIFYASSNYTLDSTAPCIRVFDGTIDQEFVRIPLDPSVSATIQCQGILSMLLVGETIYLTVYDDDDGSIGTGTGGRVFKLDPSTGALTQLGAKFVTDTSGADLIPYSLAWHAGRLWVGTYNRQSAAGITGKIYWFTPGVSSAWTLDRTMAVGRGVSSLSSFQGQLFAGSSDGAGTCTVEVRSSIGAWTTSYTSAGGNSTFLGALVFGSALYINEFNVTTNASLIKKFDGSSWTTAYTGSGGTLAPLPMAWTDSGTVYFGGGGSGIDAVLVTSTDGASWTDRTANLTAHTGLNTIGILAT